MKTYKGDILYKFSVYSVPSLILIVILITCGLLGGGGGSGSGGGCGDSGSDVDHKNSIFDTTNFDNISKVFQIIGGFVFMCGHIFQLWKINNDCDLNIVAVWLISFSTFLFEIYAIKKVDSIAFFLITNTLCFILSNAVFIQVVFLSSNVKFIILILPLYTIPILFLILKYYFPQIFYTGSILSLTFEFFTMHTEKIAFVAILLSNLFHVVNFLRAKVNNFSMKQSCLVNFALTLQLYYAVARDMSLFYITLILLLCHVMSTIVYIVVSIRYAKKNNFNLVEEAADVEKSDSVILKNVVYN